MTIFAAFLCIQTLAFCELQAPPVFKSLKECKQFLNQATKPIPGITQLTLIDGRFFVGQNRGMWYECRSKHVDTWEPAH